MNLADALNELANNPSLTTAELIDLAGQVDVGVGSASVKLGYSGYVGGYVGSGPQNVSAGEYTTCICT